MARTRRRSRCAVCCTGADAAPLQGCTSPRCARRRACCRKVAGASAAASSTCCAHPATLARAPAPTPAPTSDSCSPRAQLRLEHGAPLPPTAASPVRVVGHPCVCYNLLQAPPAGALAGLASLARRGGSGSATAALACRRARWRLSVMSPPLKDSSVASGGAHGVPLSGRSAARRSREAGAAEKRGGRSRVVGRVPTRLVDPPHRCPPKRVSQMRLQGGCRSRPLRLRGTRGGFASGGSRVCVGGGRGGLLCRGRSLRTVCPSLRHLKLHATTAELGGAPRISRVVACSRTEPREARSSTPRTPQTRAMRQDQHATEAPRALHRYWVAHLLPTR